MARPLQHLLLVTLEDPANPRSWSGIPHSLATALARRIPRLSIVSGKQLRPRRTALHSVMRAALGGTPPRWPLWMTEPSLRHYAAVVEQAIHQHQPDAVLSISSQCLVHLHTKVPTYFYNDAPWYTFMQTYARWDAVPLRARTFAAREAEAARRTRLVFTGSGWAADQAAKLYRLPRSRIVEAHLGANWIPDAAPAGLLQYAADKANSVATGGTLELLFIGKDWERKGGPLALEITALLHSQGQAVRLHIVGCRPPVPEGLADIVSIHGALDLGNAAHRAHLQQLFIASHFLLVPTQAECFGIVFAESQAFAVPPVSRQVCGLPSIVNDATQSTGSETGILLPAAAPASAYASRILEVTTDPARYIKMATHAQARFAAEFTWDHVAKVIQQGIEATLP